MVNIYWLGLYTFSGSFPLLYLSEHLSRKGSLTVLFDGYKNLWESVFWKEGGKQFFWTSKRSKQFFWIPTFVRQVLALPCFLLELFKALGKQVLGKGKKNLKLIFLNHFFLFFKVHRETQLSFIAFWSWIIYQSKIRN